MYVLQEQYRYMGCDRSAKHNLKTFTCVQEILKIIA